MEVLGDACLPAAASMATGKPRRRMQTTPAEPVDVAHEHWQQNDVVPAA